MFILLTNAFTICKYWERVLERLSKITNSFTPVKVKERFLDKYGVILLTQRRVNAFKVLLAHEETLLLIG